MRILFMGGHELGKVTLEHLINKGMKICGIVITDTDNPWYSGVDEVAIKYGIRLFKESNINSCEFVSKVKELNPDLIVVVNFEQILKKEIIKVPIKGCINTHASLLPKYRGRAPLNWSIINGEKETGVTVHYIEEGIDTGDIISQEKIKIKEDDYIGDVLEKVKKIYPFIVYDAIEKIKNNKIKVIKQDLGKGCYCKKRNAEDGTIDWKEPSQDIYGMIRAVSKPYPGARTYYKGKEIIIWRAKLQERNEIQVHKKSGLILECENNHILVSTNPDKILITEYEINDDSENVDIVIGEYFDT